MLHLCIMTYSPGRHQNNISYLNLFAAVDVGVGGSCGYDLVSTCHFPFTVYPAEQQLTIPSQGTKWKLLRIYVQDLHKSYTGNIKRWDKELEEY